MSLRILLADESTSIKKAFQLALSDLGVEIKSVPSGLDVLSVALDFKPTLVFADILLTKKSGYEICKELKENALTKHVPVILMWSQFMEFNQTSAEKAGFSDRLEKPFDTDTLRKIVLRFFTQAETHPLKNKIQLPSFSDFDEDFKPVQLSNNLTENLSGHSDTEIEEIEEPDNYNHINNHRNHDANQNDSTIYLETESYGDFEEVVLVKSPQKRTESQKNVISPSASQQLHSLVASKVGAQLNQQVSHQVNNLVNNPMNSKANAQFNSQVNENLIREEVRIMTEKICWQIIPEIAEKIIKEEIQKLMKNIEKSV